MEEMVKEIFHFHTGKPSTKIIPSATFDDLDMDSLDCLEVCIDIEDKFNIKISDEEFESLKNIQEVMDLIKDKVTPPVPAEEKPKDG